MLALSLSINEKKSSYRRSSTAVLALAHLWWFLPVSTSVILATSTRVLSLYFHLLQVAPTAEASEQALVQAPRQAIPGAVVR